MSARTVHRRGFASLLTTFSFAVMSLSGIVLFIVPQGRIAEWTGWRMLGLTKPDWGNIHITTSLMFLLAGGYHIACNWRTLVSYFSNRRQTGLAMKRELAISAALTVFFVAGAIYQVPPLSYVLTLNNAVKMAWIVDKDHEPPIGHAELLTVPAFARRMQIDAAQAAEVLRRSGIRYTETESLALIARRHGIAPVSLYQLIKPLEGTAGAMAATAGNAGTQMQAGPAPQATSGPHVYTEALVDEYFEGRGMGRKTLAMIAGENGLDVTLARRKLAERNLLVRDDETIKDAAMRTGTAPIEIMKAIFVGEPIRK